MNRHTGNLIDFRIEDEKDFSNGKEAIEENKAREVANTFLKNIQKKDMNFIHM